MRSFGTSESSWLPELNHFLGQPSPAGCLPDHPLLPAGLLEGCPRLKKEKETNRNKTNKQKQNNNNKHVTSFRLELNIRFAI